MERINLGRKKELGSRKRDTCKGIKKPKIMQISIRDSEFIKIHFYMDAEMASSLSVNNKHILQIISLILKDKRKKNTNKTKPCIYYIFKVDII